MSDSSESRSIIRRATANFGRLLRGRGVAAVLELVTLAILARTLSPGPFGNLVLIQTYALVFHGLFSFKLYEVVVRFGVPLLEADDRASFRQLVRFTLFIDIASSVVGTVGAVMVAMGAGSLLGWDSGINSVTMLYSLVLLTYGYGTAKGVLRIFDRYDLLANQVMITPLLRLIGVLIVYLLEPTLMLFVIALAITTAAGNLYLIAMGWFELRRQIGAIPFKGPSLRLWQEQFPGLRKFLIILYWQGNVDLLPKHVSTLLAGALLGSVGAGLLRLAREAGKIISKPGALLRQVLFPDLVRTWDRGTSSFRFILWRAVIASALFGLVFVLVSLFAGSALLDFGLGADYAPAAPLMTLLLLVATIELMATVLRDAGYAIGDAGKILRLNLLGSAVYLPLFVVLATTLGLIGAGVAACVAVLIPFVGTGLLVASGIRKQRASMQLPD